MSLDHGAGSTREDISLSCSDLVCCQQQRSSRTRFGLHSGSQEIDSSRYDLKMHGYTGTNVNLNRARTPTL